MNLKEKKLLTGGNTVEDYMKGIGKEEMEEEKQEDNEEKKKEEEEQEQKKAGNEEQEEAYTKTKRKGASRGEGKCYKVGRERGETADLVQEG